MLSGETGNLSFSYDGMTALSEMLSAGRWGSLARTCVGLVRGGTRLGTVAAQLLAPYLPAAAWASDLRAPRQGPPAQRLHTNQPGLEPSILQWAAETGSDINRRPQSDPHASQHMGPDARRPWQYQ